jgi:hypothetical protein
LMGNGANQNVEEGVVWLQKIIESHIKSGPALFYLGTLLLFSHCIVPGLQMLESGYVYECGLLGSIREEDGLLCYKAAMVLDDRALADARWCMSRNRFFSSSIEKILSCYILNSDFESREERLCPELGRPH